jgi:hypothetical protein
MTPDDFRRLALAQPEAVESEHMRHPDFRVGGKVFATLGAPDAGHAMVKLTPEAQERCLRLHPAVFAPAAGAWGRRGCTLVTLERATAKLVAPAVAAAWRATAPKAVAARHPPDGGQ